MSIALSGGSTPEPLYTLLGSHPWREALSHAEITWVVVDERCVPFDDRQSNAGMITRTLFAQGMSPGHRFLPFRTDRGEPREIAEAFESEWHSLGLQVLDLVLLGIGDDGHTASLFPGTPVLAVTGRIAHEVFVPKLGSWRVTLTAPVIRAARDRIVVVAGASKREIVRKVAAEGDYPVTAVTSGGIESWWMMDREAAGEEGPPA